jgi:hypothetical protein
VTGDELAQAGKRLYGEHWLTPLARALGADIRTVRRWLHDQYPVPDAVAVDIAALLEIATKRKGVNR